MMELVAPILDILIRLRDCIGDDLGSIRDFEANTKALENAVDQLKNINEDVKRRVVLDEERHMVRKKLVDVWLHNVEDIEKRANDVLEKANREVPRRSCCGCPRNCWSSYKLGKEVIEKLKAVSELKTEGSFDAVADMLPHGPVDERPLEETVGLNSVFEEVNSYIKDEKVKVVGIYGMGGVGKTTLLKKINNDFVKTNYGFELVVWIVVSKQSTVEKVQDAICEKLKLPENAWRNKSEDEKAVQIFRILHRKKFVLLLDDIWKRVDLVKVGVPPPDDQRTCKVVFTTRYEDVCGFMEADKKVKIECLSKDEALTLFRKKVGVNTLNSHPIIPKLAEVVAEACKGLPLALITIGRAMAGKSDPRDWDRAVTKLRKDPSRIMGMDDDVYHVLKFSYDSLHDDAIKSCFIYCCIYPEDHEILIDDLLELWIGEGLLDEFCDTHEARDQGREIIGKLKAASLLENGKSEEYVRMHDVIRDMALWISTGSSAKTNKYLVLDHTGLREAHRVTSWTSAERISLWGSSIRSIIEIPHCPSVVTFLVRHTAIRMFPSEFLQFMYVVKVLDLSFNFQLAELPSCIGKLVELQFLNLSNTRIRELPMEIKNLTKMRYLILNALYRLEMIPREVISSFSLLRVFRISSTVNSASTIASENNVLSGGRRHLLEELEVLLQINDISITIFDASSVEKLQCSHKIQSCLSSLCFEKCEGLTSLELSSSSVDRMQHLQRLDLYYCPLKQLIISPEPENMPNLTVGYGYFRSLRNVYIAYCDKLQDLTWLIHAPTLEILDVTHCPSMTEIVKDLPSHGTRTEAYLGVFSRLKKIHLLNLPYLHSIYPRPLPFPSLVEIHVGACENLRRLPFHSSSAADTLKEIRGSMWWWVSLQWDDESLRRLFSSYHGT